MRTKFAVLLFVCFLAVAQTNEAAAHIWYTMALRQHFGYRSVSCYACHQLSADFEAANEAEFEAFQRNRYQFTNDFGSRLAERLDNERIKKTYLEKKALQHKETRAKATGARR